MAKLWRNKLGITPVLSNVLLMAIAVAGMSIAITATYVITGNLRETMGERFIVEDVWFRNGEIAIYLRNTGKTAIDIKLVYVDSAQKFSNPLHLESLEHGWLNVTYSWAADTVYQVKIVTGRGTQVADYYRAPS